MVGGTIAGWMEWSDMRDFNRHDHSIYEYRYIYILMNIDR